MTPVEARQLVQRLEGAWPDRFWSDARRSEWRDELETLDAGTAGTAFARMKRNEHQKHCPSIGEFVAACRGLHTPANDPTEKCRCCDGTGWAFSHRTTQDREGTMPNGQPKPPLVYDFVKPCPECPNGARLAPLAARVETEREKAKDR